MSRVPAITRRTLLRGAGSIAVALPPLEIMLRPRTSGAAAATPPRRFAMSWAGVALAADRHGAEEGVTPKTTGLGWAAPRSLKPLGDMGILPYISVVSGLLIPWALDPPFPGGKGLLVHFNTIGPQLAGTRGGAGAMGTSSPKGSTVDQVVADAISGGTANRQLAYRLQAHGYVGSGSPQSYRMDKGSLAKIEPISSPRVAYEALFSTFKAPSTTSGDMARDAFLLRQGKSVLDIVSGDLASLKNKLGAADQIRVQKHADEVRQLELGLDKVAPVGAACKMFPNPGPDPARETGYAYAGEDMRGDVFANLIAMAFACDLSRVASYMLTHEKCWMGLPPGFPRKVPDIHQMSHESSGAEFADAVGYLVKQWGKVLKKLKDIPENDGSNVLDHTAAVMVFEAGHGKDSEAGGKDNAHSTENMCILVGGGASGKIKKGSHVAATGKHPAQALITVMNAMGMPQNALGEVTGNIPQLLT